MNNYKPHRYAINQPVEYIAEQGDIPLSGHYAYQDEEGYHYVWETGGTSYTRAVFSTTENDQTIRCYFISPQHEHAHGVTRTAEVKRVFYS